MSIAPIADDMDLSCPDTVEASLLGLAPTSSSVGDIYQAGVRDARTLTMPGHTVPHHFIFMTKRGP